ncbi:hypothetical protein D5G26_21725, partial [Salmonella enterica subsp. enterica serovar Mbandaka]
NNIIEIYRFILMKKNRYVIYSTQKILNPYFIIINIININVFVKIRKPISFCKMTDLMWMTR